MKHNVGMADRIFRLVAGVVLLSLTQVLEGDIRWVGLIGIVPILTAAFGFCPMYCPFKINTSCCKGTDKESGSCCGAAACGPKDGAPTA